MARPSHEVTVPIEPPTEVVAWAQYRAIADGRPDDIEDYLTECLRLDVEWEIEQTRGETQFLDRRL